MSGSDALERVRRLGLAAHVTAVVDAAPPLPSAAVPIVAELRRKVRR